MNHTSEILGIVSHYCELTGLSRATVATQVMNDGKFFDRIEAGGGFTMKTYQKVKDWFALHMPKKETKRRAVVNRTAASVNAEI